MPHAAVFSGYLDVDVVLNIPTLFKIAATGDGGRPLGSLALFRDNSLPVILFGTDEVAQKSTATVNVALGIDQSLVHTFNAPAGALGTIDGFTGDVLAGYGNNFLMPVEDVFAFSFPEPLLFEGGGVSIMITEIVVRPASPSDADQVTEVGLFSSGMESFLITDFAAFEQPSTIEPVFLRGDATATGAVDFTDAIVTLEVVLLGRGELTCLDAADSNDDGIADLTDAIVTLEEVFLGRIGIQAPGPFVCGEDPTEDSLGCETYDACP